MNQAKTILLVDDDAEIRGGLKLVLNRKGYRTLEAGNGWEARQVIEEHSPDLVILDMMMPQWGGLAVLEHFRGQLGAPPFIMLTGNDVPMHKSYAERLGVEQYISKPFSLDQLLERVLNLVPLPRPQPDVAQPPVGCASFERCRCPGCGARLKVPVQLLGQSRACPGCRKDFVLRPASLEDQDVMLIMN
jgi:DNA-binding response OmpR family regulator